MNWIGGRGGGGGGDDASELTEEEEEEPPTKRLRTGDVLLSSSASRTVQCHADQSLLLLGFAQFLEEARDKCMLCTLRSRGSSARSSGPHSIPECPQNRQVCLKCLGQAHRSSSCPNRVPWRPGQCYGCGLPNKLGRQILHPEKFGIGCKSVGHDKIVPGCWYMWRNYGTFSAVLERSGCSRDLSDDKFARWMADPHGTYGTNAVHLIIQYVRSTLDEDDGLSSGAGVPGPIIA